MHYGYYEQHASSIEGKIIAIEYFYLAQLTSRASRVEQCIVEKEQKRSSRAGPIGPQLISVNECHSAEEDRYNGN